MSSAFPIALSEENSVFCCPKCKSVLIKVHDSKWSCKKPGCNWKGNYPAWKLNKKNYNDVLEKVLEQAQIQNVTVLALNEGIILPVEITEGI